MLEFFSVKHQYSGSFHCIEFDFKSARGEHCLVTGSSGSGKTTLLHIAGGLLKPGYGEVILDETSIYKLKSRQLDIFRGRNIGIVFQKPCLINSLSVIENVLAAAYFSGKKQDFKKAVDLLEELNIAELKDKKPFMLSHGQAQRVAVARAVINEPALILADEPTSSLDKENCQSVINLFKKNALKNNSSLVVTSHDTRLNPFFEKIIYLETPLAQ